MVSSVFRFITVGHDEEMTVIKINAITEPADSGDELAHRFAVRAGAVDNAEDLRASSCSSPLMDASSG